MVGTTLPCRGLLRLQLTRAAPVVMCPRFDACTRKHKLWLAGLCHTLLFGPGQATELPSASPSRGPCAASAGLHRSCIRAPVAARWPFRRTPVKALQHARNLMQAQQAAWLPVRRWTTQRRMPCSSSAPRATRSSPSRSRRRGGGAASVCRCLPGLQMSGTSRGHSLLRRRALGAQPFLRPHPCMPIVLQLEAHVAAAALWQLILPAGVPTCGTRLAATLPHPLGFLRAVCRC